MGTRRLAAEFLVALVSLASVLSCSQKTQERVVQYATYNSDGISIEYPGAWRDVSNSADAETMKMKIASGLAQFNRTLLSFAAFALPNDEGVLSLSKVQLQAEVTDNDILSERSQVHADATRDGYVTKVNTLTKARIKEWPAIVEDVELSNGGRAHCVKVIARGFYVELSMSLDKSQYQKYVTAYNHSLESLQITQ
ncbi:MAG: hypothetical protein QME66_12570 [Candidatus Eisenbacteria bacterium]|nr:hypothetical protein [Candidatus Eisenbacteria bacterium]